MVDGQKSAEACHWVPIQRAPVRFSKFYSNPDDPRQMRLPLLATQRPIDIALHVFLFQRFAFIEQLFAPTDAQ